MSEQADALNRALRQRGVVPPNDNEPPAEAVVDDSRDLPPLELPREGRRLEAFAREAGAIARCNGVFRRERSPVTVNYETGMMELLEADRFRSYIENLALTFKWRSAGQNTPPQMVPCTMTADAARATIKSDQFVEQQRRLARINTVRQPVMRDDGRIELLAEGYDAESETYTLPNKVVIDESWDLDRARTFLVDFHKEFMFADKDASTGMSRGLAIHIAGMLALYGSGLQDLNEPRLNFVYDANGPGSGKGLLVKIAVIPVMGLCEVQTIPDNKQEFRKVLDSAALGSVPYLFFDEIEGNVRNADLNAFMTSDYWTGRAFNTQRLFRCPKITISYLAGNNLSLSPDIARRTLSSQLYIEESDLRDRKIDRILTSKFLSSPPVRSDLLSAEWAMIRAWDKAGRPPAGGRAAPKRIPGFESWSEIFGGIVEYAGFGCPLDPPPVDQSKDTEGDDMKALVTRLAAGMVGKGNLIEEKLREFTFEQVIEACLEQNCFPWIIEGKWREEKFEGEVVARRYECTPKSAAIMGKLFADRFGGRTFRIAGVGVVRFGKRGKNRHRRYQVTVE